MNIMIVDDDREYAEELTGLLQNAGYEVAAFADGVTALSKVTQVKPAVILLDFKMDDFTGNQLAWYLRTCRDTAQIPIIGMSGFTGNANPVELAAACGINAFFKKPFYPLDIIAKIEQLTGAARDEIVPVPIMATFPRARHAAATMLVQS